jgi:hypothetical protein
MAELAEGARLLSEYGGKLPSRVRIPVSPPFKKYSLGYYLGLYFLKKRLIFAIQGNTLEIATLRW